MSEELVLTLVSQRMLSGSIREVVLAAKGGGVLPGFTAGAHVDFRVPAGSRSYSLVVANDDERFAEPAHYRFAVQMEDREGGGSSHLHAMKEGEEISATPPKNDFELVETAPALLVAGGIGITPILSMATMMKRAGRDFRVLYAARSPDHMAYRDELKQLFGGHIDFHFDSEAGGPIDAIALAGTVKEDEHVYVCGPKPMIEAVKSACEAAGVGQSRIHFELFTSDASQKGDGSFQVEVASTGAVYDVPAGRTIIDVLEAAGIDLMYDCKRGDCGICQTDVVEGMPDHRDVVLTDTEKAENKVMQICVSRAKSAKLVLDL